MCLLSGGVDSLVGAIDAVSAGRRPVLVSQVARGDKDRQKMLANEIGEDLSHLQLTHAIKPPSKVRTVTASAIYGLSRLRSACRLRASATLSR